jgi:hypothetical protein
VLGAKEVIGNHKFRNQRTDNVMARKKIWKKPKQILVFENSVF